MNNDNSPTQFTSLKKPKEQPLEKQKKTEFLDKYYSKEFIERYFSKVTKTS